MLRLTTVSVVALVLIIPQAGRGQWSSDPTVGTPISTSLQPLFAEVKGYPDSQGGAILKWRNKATTSALSQAQRISAEGEVLWGEGTPEFGGTSFDNTLAVPDGQGGFFAAWQSYGPNPNGAVFVQKFSSSGQPQWSSSGLRVSTNPTPSESNFALSPDNSGGVIVTWEGELDSSGTRRLAQRIDATATRQWAATGVVISTVNELQRYFSAKAVTDEAGGILTTWAGNRSSDFAEFEVVSQRVDANGTVLWNPQGNVISDAPYFSQMLDMKSDGSGGAYIVWSDGRSNSTNNIYCQRITAAGIPLWTSNGVAVSSENRYRNTGSVQLDNENNLLIGWIPIFGSPSQVAVQKLDKATGVPLWGPAGITVNVSANGSALNLEIASDGLGGVIAVWSELQSGDQDIVAQRVNAQGNLVWQAGGVPVSNHPAMQDYPTIVGIGSNGAIVAWSDARNAGSETTPNTDVYAAYLEPDGSLRAGPTAADGWGIYE